jgi:uncharacterized membrane protein YoaK (UPF0700 family)
MVQDFSLALLAAAAGTLDVLGYLRLGPALMSAMTGNGALLGLAVGQHQFAAALHSLVAFAGFIAGIAAGTRVVGDADAGWSPRVTTVVAIEAVLLAAFALLWLTTDNPHADIVIYTLVLLASGGMGLQSAAVRQLGIPGVTTTFFTGTLTSIVTSAVRAGRRKLPTSMIPQLVALVAYVGAAAFAGLAAIHGTNVIALLPVTAVVVTLAPRAVAGAAR